MGRPRKLTTDEMLGIVNDFYESNGDPARLKCSFLEEYALSLGIDVKAYDFRRNTAVRQRMDELRDLSILSSDEGAIAYKGLDVDALLVRNRTTTMMRNSLLELDETWRRIYERAVSVSKDNELLRAEVKTQAENNAAILSEMAELESQKEQIKRENKALVLENRYLRKMLRQYLYPAIANEILKNENVLSQVDTDVTPTAMANLSEPAVPTSFSQSVSADMAMLSREESLLSRMRDQIDGGDVDEKKIE